VNIINLPKDLTIEKMSNFTVAQACIEDAECIGLNTVAGETDFLTFGLDEFPLSIEEEANTILDCPEKECCLL
jgi:hypothetical protein